MDKDVCLSILWLDDDESFLGHSKAKKMFEKSISESGIDGIEVVNAKNINKAVSIAKGKYVIFVDKHISLKSEDLDRIVNRICNNDMGMIVLTRAEQYLSELCKEQFAVAKNYMSIIKTNYEDHFYLNDITGILYKRDILLEAIKESKISSRPMLRNALFLSVLENIEGYKINKKVILKDDFDSFYVQYSQGAMSGIYGRSSKEYYDYLVEKIENYNKKIDENNGKIEDAIQEGSREEKDKLNLSNYRLITNRRLYVSQFLYDVMVRFNSDISLESSASINTEEYFNILKDALVKLNSLDIMEFDSEVMPRALKYYLLKLKGTSFKLVQGKNKRIIMDADGNVIDSLSSRNMLPYLSGDIFVPEGDMSPRKISFDKFPLCDTKIKVYIKDSITNMTLREVPMYIKDENRLSFLGRDIGGLYSIDPVELNIGEKLVFAENDVEVIIYNTI